MFFRHRSLLNAAVVVAALNAPSQVAAQMIQIKTLPITEGEQWRFFPSANVGLGGLSIALPDSLSDPFESPAKGSRLSDRGRGLFFGAPTVYSVSKNAGGGRTLPFGGVMRSGATFGGLAVAIQEIDAVTRESFISPLADVAVTDFVPTQVTTGAPSRQNRFAFASLGHLFADKGLSVGASVLWSGLNAVDGVDYLYAGSRAIEQDGHALNLRLGLLKEWSGGRSLEAMVLHDRFNMAQDVTWTNFVWDTTARMPRTVTRIDHNLDRTNTWGLHLGLAQPLADSGWRIGAIVTTNLMSHPKLPDYQVAQVMTIPRDPGHSAAYDFGVGVAKVKGLTTFGLDAILEPIRTHTWGEAAAPIATTRGVVPAGAKTTENWFSLSNAIVRTGLGRDIPIDTGRGSLKSLRLEAGASMRAISYVLDQQDHVSLIARRHRESWMEWTRTWGAGIRFTDMELRYVGRMTTGTGRPGIQSCCFVGGLAVAADAGRNFLSPPTGDVALTPVTVTTHQLSVSMPIR